MAIEFATTTQTRLTYELALKQAQEYFSRNNDAMVEDARKQADKGMLQNSLEKFINDRHIAVDNYNTQQLARRIYEDMALFSILTPYLKRKDIEEININAWNDIKINYSNGKTLPMPEKFLNNTHAYDVLSRLLRDTSKMTLDLGNPTVVGYIEYEGNNIRITSVGPPVLDEKRCIAASLRFVNPTKLTKEQFINHGTATAQMMDFMVEVLSHNVSIAMAGATGSGKTTLMSWILSNVPLEQRIVTIETGCREFDLTRYDEQGNVVNNVVHFLTWETDAQGQIRGRSQNDLLKTALTMNPDIICMAEAKDGDEAMSATEAARTGHAVISTVHANSCRAVYDRLVTQCKMKYDLDYDTLFHLVTEAFPIAVYCKKMQDGKRRIMEITECVAEGHEKRHFITLYRYQIQSNAIAPDGSIIISGSYVKENDISESLRQRLIENGMSAEKLNRL